MGQALLGGGVSLPDYLEVVLLYGAFGISSGLVFHGYLGLRE